MQVLHCLSPIFKRHDVIKKSMKCVCVPGNQYFRYSWNNTYLHEYQCAPVHIYIDMYQIVKTIKNISGISYLDNLAFLVCIIRKLQDMVVIASWSLRDGLQQLNQISIKKCWKVWFEFNGNINYVSLITTWRRHDAYRLGFTWAGFNDLTILQKLLNSNELSFFW